MSGPRARHRPARTGQQAEVWKVVEAVRVVGPRAAFCFFLKWTSGDILQREEIRIFQGVLE